MTVQYVCEMFTVLASAETLNELKVFGEA